MMSIRSGLMLGILVLVPLSLTMAPSSGSDEGEQAPGPPRFDGCGVFVENKGQYDPALLYVARTSWGHVGLTSRGMLYDIAPDGCARAGHVIELKFASGSPSNVAGSDPVGTTYNYFHGNDPSAWAIGAQGYGRVVYIDVWDGIDVAFYGDEQGMEYDVILHPGADPGDVLFHAEGIDSLSVQGGAMDYVYDGRAIFRDSAPVSFYEGSGGLVGSSFRVEGTSFGFDLARYDPSRTVVIDPKYNAVAIHFSTYFGGNDLDEPYEMDTDPSGNILVTGCTLSDNIPTTAGAYQLDRHANYTTEVFVFEIRARGDGLNFCTYVGGSANDRGTGIRVDSYGGCIVAGQTASSDFPTTGGALERNMSWNTTDLFIFRLSGDGGVLVNSTCIAGSDFDGSPVLDIDGDDMVYLSAVTFSDDFPVTADAYQGSITPGSWGSEMVVLKYDLDRMELLYSTYMGGKGTDTPKSIVQQHEDVYVAGCTDSTDFDVTTGVYQNFRRGYVDGFVMQLDIEGSRLMFSTYFGGSQTTVINDITVDPDFNHIYACGDTSSPDMPVTEGAGDRVFSGGQEAFVFEMSQSGRDLFFSTFFGGAGMESFGAIDLDRYRSPHLAGYVTNPNMHPLTFGAMQTTPGGGSSEAIYVRMEGDGSNYTYSTFIGGQYDESAVDVLTVANTEYVLLLLSTDSVDMPVRYAYDPNCNGGEDVYLMKLDTTLPPGPIWDLNGSAGDEQVSLWWQPPVEDGGAPVLEYEVLRGVEDAPDKVLGRTVVPQMDDVSVENGVEYSYAVRAVNRIGSGPLSKALWLEPDRVPYPPQYFAVDHMGDSIDLTFYYTEAAPFSVDGFRIFRAAGEGNFSLVGDVSGGPFHDYYFEPGIVYRYYLTAYNGKGESGPSQTISYVVETMPGAVRNLAAGSGSSTVSLSWDPPENDGGSRIIRYELQRARIDDDEFGTRISIDGSNTSYVDTVRNGYDVKYRMSAVNKKGMGPFSPIVYGYPRGVPDPPEGLEVYFDGSFAELQWYRPSNDGGYTIIAYDVYRSIDTGPWEHIGTCDNLTGRYSDEDILNGIVHRYRVTATNMRGESSPSKEVSVIPVKVPSPPLDFKGNASDGMVALSWKDPSDDGGSRITSYRIYRGLNATNMDPIRTVKEMRYVDDEVENGIFYDYMIRAVNDVGEGAPSDIIRLRPLGLPSPPTSVKAFGYNGMVSIAWAPPSRDGGDKVISVRVYRAVADGSMSFLESVVLEAGAYQDHDVTNGVVYKYYLTSVNSVGEGPGSELVEASPSGPPSAPRNVTISMSDGWITIKWREPLSDGGHPVQNYKVLRSVEGASYRLVAQVGGTVGSTSERVPREGKEVTYWVSAVNEIGEGPMSEPARITIDRGEDRESLMVFVLLGIFAALLISLALFLVARALSWKRSPPQVPAGALPASQRRVTAMRNVSSLAMQGPPPPPQAPKKAEIPMDREFVKAMFPGALGPDPVAPEGVDPPEMGGPAPVYREYIDLMMPTFGEHPVEEGPEAPQDDESVVPDAVEKDPRVGSGKI